MKPNVAYIPDRVQSFSKLDNNSLSQTKFKKGKDQDLDRGLSSIVSDDLDKASLVSDFKRPVGMFESLYKILARCWGDE